MVNYSQTIDGVYWIITFWNAVHNATWKPSTDTGKGIYWPVEQPRRVKTLWGVHPGTNVFTSLASCCKRLPTSYCTSPALLFFSLTYWPELRYSCPRKLWVLSFKWWPELGANFCHYRQRTTSNACDRRKLIVRCFLFLVFRLWTDANYRLVVISRDKRVSRILYTRPQN